MLGLAQVMAKKIVTALANGLLGLAAFPRTSKTRAMKTVLLADRDLGFVLWLAAALDRAGYRALPAPSSQDVVEWFNELQVPVHLVIVACSLPDASALVRSLRRSRPHLKIIALTDDGADPCPTVPDADLYCRRSRSDEASETHWLDTIQGVLAADPKPARQRGRTGGAA